MRPRSGCALDLKDSRGCDDMIAAIFRRRRMRASCRRLKHRGWRNQRYAKDIVLHVGQKILQVSLLDEA